MKNNVELTKNLAEWAKTNGANLFGVADLTSTPIKTCGLSADILRSLPRAIVLGFRLSRKILEDIQDKPTPLYFHHYRQVNNALDRVACLLTNRIQAEGWDALPIPASQVIDWEKQRGHLSHKILAHAAGMGWIGRNNLLITAEFGAAVRLVSVLTNMPLVPATPLSRDCGACRRCLSVCPANAIRESQKDFDHHACYDKLREFRKQHLVGQYVCGVCVKACC